MRCVLSHTLVIALCFASCSGEVPNYFGDKSDDSGDPGNPNVNLDDPPKLACVKAWRAFVAARPQGMTSRYLYRSPDAEESRVFNEITESTDLKVTQRTISGVNTTSVITTKDDFVRSCVDAKKNETNGGGTLELERKENKTVQAGTFLSLYRRVRTLSASQPTTKTTLSETWTTTDDRQVLVYEKTTVIAGAIVSESTLELISVN